MYATSLNIWHVQKACPHSRQRHTQNLLYRSIKLGHNTVALETSLWQSSPRGRQCLCCTAELKSSFKAASPFSQHRPSHNTSYPKVLTLQVQLSESDQLSTRGRGAGCYTRGAGSEQSVHNTKNSYSKSLATQTGVLNPLQDPERDSVPAILTVLQNIGKCIVDVGQPNKAVQLCLLRAHQSPQDAHNHAWLSRAGRERQGRLKMPQSPLKAYSKTSDRVVRYCSISGCHLSPFLYARLPFLKRTFST